MQKVRYRENGKRERRRKMEGVERERERVRVPGSHASLPGSR